MKANTVVLALLVLLSRAPVARAAMEAVAEACPGSTSICVWQRPRLAPPPGWRQADAASARYQANAFVPTGTDFKDAAAVMYAKAVPANGKGDLSEFMAGDLAEFQRQYPGLRIQSGLTAANGDGKPVRLVRLAPSAGSNAQWESLAYDQEGGYVLIFALSARNQAAHAAALPAFEAMLKNYRASGPARTK